MREELINIFSKAMQVDSSAIDVNVPLASYGMDSLSVAEILDEVEKQFGVNLDEESLYMDDPAIVDVEMMLNEAR